MPLALLLSPDDQAVSAITAVLEEMSVTCERPLDGASAAQKLNSNRFDLVLVDCENLPAAKLIFDVCRNRKGAGRPVPVAVVDGRAGLPTAFRLGAELILTKPVAKDQARMTIRTAISRVKREDAAETGSGNAPAASAAQESGIGKSAALSGAAGDHNAPQEQALAAAAGAGNPSLTSFSDPYPSSFTPAATTSTPPMKMSAAVAESNAVEDDSTIKTGPRPATGGSSTASASRTASSLESRIASRTLAQSSPKGPVPAAPEKSKTSADANPNAAAKSPAESDVKANAKQQTVASSTPENEERKPAAGGRNDRSKKKRSEKSHGRAIALLVLLMACGGFYAAWTYEPGFQALAKAQINHLLVVLGVMPPQQHPAPVPVAPASQTAKPVPGVPVQAATPDASQNAPPSVTDLNGAPGATSGPAPTTTVPPASSASSIGQLASTPGPQSGSTTPAQSAASQTKAGVTRIQLAPNAMEHAATTPGTKAGSKGPPQR